jgi:hypothetical protein
MEVGQGPNWGCSAKVKKNMLGFHGLLYVAEIGRVGTAVKL